MKTETSIILDETFKAFLKTFKNENAFIMEQLRENDNKETTFYNEIILKCRDFRRNFNIGKQNTKYFNPDNFAFIIALSLEIDKYNEWEDIFLNKSFSIDGVYTQKIDENDNSTDWGCSGFLTKGDEKQRCICSHASKTIVYLKSNETGIILPVGTNCIEKHKIISKENLKALEKGIKETQKKKNECICEYCSKSFIPKFEGVKNCLCCYIQHKKPCIKCGIDFLPQYKTRKYAKKCYKCFIASS